MAAVVTDAESYVPQRRPFVFVDSMVSYGESQCVTELLVREDCPLVVDSFMSGAGIVEFVAQSCALKMGYEDRLAGIEDTRPGMIGAVTRLECSRDARVGEKLVCRLTVEGSYDRMVMIGAEVFSEEERIACVSMKIVQGEGLI